MHCVPIGVKFHSKLVAAAYERYLLLRKGSKGDKCSSIGPSQIFSVNQPGSICPLVKKGHELNLASPKLCDETKDILGEQTCLKRHVSIL